MFVNGILDEVLFARLNFLPFTESHVPIVKLALNAPRAFATVPGPAVVAGRGLLSPTLTDLSTQLPKAAHWMGGWMDSLPSHGGARKLSEEVELDNARVAAKNAEERNLRN